MPSKGKGAAEKGLMVDLTNRDALGAHLFATNLGLRQDVGKGGLVHRIESPTLHALSRKMRGRRRAW